MDMPSHIQSGTMLAYLLDEANGWTSKPAARDGDGLHGIIFRKKDFELVYPHPKARDRERRLRDVLAVLIIAEGDPLLQFGPLTGREAAYAIRYEQLRSRVLNALEEPE
jgi:hypothetical protein